MLYTATRRRTAHARAAQSKEGWLEGSHRLPDKVGKEYMRSIFRELAINAERAPAGSPEGDEKSTLNPEPQIQQPVRNKIMMQESTC